MENEGMNRACSVHGADEKSIKMLGRIPEIEMQLERQKLRTNGKIILKCILKK
jgi:hypothetical protein